MLKPEGSQYSLHLLEFIMPSASVSYPSFPEITSHSSTLSLDNMLLGKPVAFWSS